ncbi:MAG TPA: PfaD family polyunsaturated fatty acid/polyketide biosynthesis protein [Phycisphaerae bacterium]|nr:PfaD family polyunsaturated fatty acid/polyketide biosynthesis protein [Phycisphaerae bacterium]
MSQLSESKQDSAASLAKTALDGGLSVLSAATSGAKTGAKLAVGTLFAGCNVLLDLGVRVSRMLPLDSQGLALRLKTTDGDIPVVERSVKVPKDKPAPLGWWLPDAAPPRSGDEAVAEALAAVTQNVYLVDCDGQLGIGAGGRAVLGADTAGLEQSYALRAFAPALHPRQLGDPAFCEAHRVRYPYMAGSMANGISSEELVEAMSRAGMLSFFGAAGLPLERIQAAIDRLQRNLGDSTFGMNLIHSPSEPDHEAAVADLYLRRGIRVVEAAAYLDLTLPAVRYRVTGIHRDETGRVICPNKVIAKVSRTEVARKFLSPPPTGMLTALVQSGAITHEQAAMAESVPMADDLTVEADSAGHTDNRPAIALVPAMISLRDDLQAKHQYTCPPRVGAAGGIATPASAAAAFAMGAAYVLTGSVNQSCVESGTSPVVREMLAHATQADTMMAPAADMFEMGVRVQVLKWGTMFAIRAKKLHDLYRAHASLDELPAAQRTMLEKDYFRCSLDEAWADTRRFWEGRDPRQIERAEKDPKHKMALVFRSFLGRASVWATSGDASRKADYQVWCGPGMGAFNEWARGSFFEKPEHRNVVTVAMNLLLGAAVLTRANWLRAQGVTLPPAAMQFRPRELTEISSLLGQ